MISAQKALTRSCHSEAVHTLLSELTFSGPLMIPRKVTSLKLSSVYSCGTRSGYRKRQLHVLPTPNAGEATYYQNLRRSILESRRGAVLSLCPSALAEDQTFPHSIVKWGPLYHNRANEESSPQRWCITFRNRAPSSTL